MTTFSTRRAVSALVLSASLFTTAFNSYAHAGVPGSGQPEGSHVWGDDGFCHIVRGGQLVRDGYFRSFPDRNNRTLYELFYNGQYVKRVDVSQAGWTKELTPAYSAPASPISWYMFQNGVSKTETNIYFFIKVFNRYMTLPQLRATIAAVNRQGAPAGGGAVLGGYGGSSAGSSGSGGTYIGGGTSTPNPNPLTVDSVAADIARQQMTPEMRQQLAALDALIQQSNDNIIKVNVLGTHVYRTR